MQITSHFDVFYKSLNQHDLLITQPGGHARNPIIEIAYIQYHEVSSAFAHFDADVRVDGNVNRYWRGLLKGDLAGIRT
jgi:hypothetical protein